MALEEKAQSNSAISIFKGVSIYKVANSKYWYVRVWDSDRKKYIVKGTGQTSSILARKAAQELAIALLKEKAPVVKEFSFKIYCLKLLRNEKEVVDRNQRSVGSFKAMKWCIENKDWGLIKRFGDRDVREITTRDFREYMNYLDVKNPDWAASTKNTILATFRNVLKVAQEESVIDNIPDTPRSKQKDNPRPFFKFHPLVSKNDDQYQKVLRRAELMVEEGVVSRGIPVTEELRDILLFITHSFVRPTHSELYSIRHKDVTVAKDPRRLILTIVDGKTGYRVVNTMEAAVSVYERICERHKNHKPDDYIFLPQYANRVTAGKVIQRQFKDLMEAENLEHDPVTHLKHSLYSLRHTAICMRILLSGGKVNIFNLAKTAGTSVDQIERFYARNLPLNAEMAKNLQSFTDDLKPEIKIQVQDKNGDWVTVKKIEKDNKKMKAALTAAQVKFKGSRIRAIDENMNLLDLINP